MGRRPQFQVGGGSRFDTNLLGFDLSDYSHDEEEDKQYPYWGARLLILVRAIREPKADGVLWLWIKQRSRKEHLMIVTVMAFVVAVIGIDVGPYLQSQEKGKAVMVKGQTGNASMGDS